MGSDHSGDLRDVHTLESPPVMGVIMYKFLPSDHSCDLIGSRSVVTCVITFLFTVAVDLTELGQQKLRGGNTGVFFTTVQIVCVEVDKDYPLIIASVSENLIVTMRKVNAEFTPKLKLS